ncbi:MAG: hypothetical protein IPK19_13660 [Chloroflexi bacterium]|nr:hypothetical protein [Chloroflexota bacterium]
MNDANGQFGMGTEEVTVASEPGKNRRTRRRRLILGLLFLFLLLFVCSFPLLLNNLRLFVFSQPFFNYPLPPQTEVLSREAHVGLFQGNGNHCEFWARMQIHTSLTEEEVRAHYSGVTFPTVGANSVSAAMDGLEGAVRVYLRFDAEDPNRFTASIGDGIYTDGLYLWDLRCH